MPGDDRFFASTRGRIVVLLRRDSRTIDELAQALELTDNAVRTHVTGLERDGLVRRQGIRRGASKPAYAYALTAEAELLFPRQYARLLQELLGVLAEQMKAQDLRKVLAVAGQRLAVKQVLPAGDLPTRVEAAVGVLNELGGLMEFKEHDGICTIRGYSCPFLAVVPGHPEVCYIVESLLTELIDTPVREQCERGEPPQCTFEVSAR